jgi:hypothetical protein
VTAFNFKKPLLILKKAINTGGIGFFWAFHAGNTGSNPVGDAKKIKLFKILLNDFLIFVF